MKHSPTYYPTLVAAIARKTMQQRGVRLYNKRGVQAIARTTFGGDALPLLANQLGRFS